MAADHLVASFSERAAVSKEQAAVASSSASPSQGFPAVEELRSLFPPLSASVTASLEGIFRFSLFAIALLQAHRISRVCERWGRARSSFAALGSLAVTMAQRAEVGVGGRGVHSSGGSGSGSGSGSSGRERTTREKERRSRRRASNSLLLAEDISRWSVVWHFSVLQLVTGSPRLHPAARMLLKPRELDLYDSEDAAAPLKGRQLVVQRLTHLLLGDGGEEQEQEEEQQQRGEEEGGNEGEEARKGVVRGFRGARCDGGEDGVCCNIGRCGNGSGAGGNGGGGGGGVPFVADDLLRSGSEASNACAALKSQCLPPAVSLMCAGVTEAFLLLYPLSALRVGKGTRGRGGSVGGGLLPYDDNVGSVAFSLACEYVLYVFVNLLMLGLVELANSLEDPFAGGHLPLEHMVRSTLRDVARARRLAARIRGLGVGGEGKGGGNGKGGCAKRKEEAEDEAEDEAEGKGRDVYVFETVDWGAAEALLAVEYA